MNCQFADTFTNIIDLFKNNPNLTNLNFQNNRLTGNIPYTVSQLGLYTSISSLDLVVIFLVGLFIKIYLI